MQTVHPEQRRLIRLQNFFGPYPQFSVAPSIDLEAPLVIKRQQAAKNKEKTQHFIVDVSSRLLTPSQPPWVEQAILRHCLAWLRENQLGPLNDEERSAPQGHINEFSTAHFAQLEDLLLEQEAEQEATEAEESTSIALIDRDADERASEAPTGNAEDKQARELSALWSKLRQRYFPDRNDLDSYQVVWSSRRHTGTLASCSTDKRRVRVAGILNCEDAHEILEPLIYHEMCHAVLGGPIIRGGRRIFHGAEFKALERQHPEIKKLNAWIKAGNWERLVRSQKRRPR